MTEKDREKWNSRYLKKRGSTTPSANLMKYGGLASCGNALDIACGNGRNSLYMAEKGFIVDAVDISTVATNRLAGKNPNIHVICQDMDTWDIQPDHYRLIVNVRFLDRSLFPMIQEGLKTGGVLVFESFIGKQKGAYCLKPNELLRAFQSLRIIYYEEKKADHPGKFEQTASLVAIKTN